MLKLISYFFITTCIVATVSFKLLAHAESPPLADPGPVPFGCRLEQAVAVPAQVDAAQVMLDLYALEDNEQRKILRGPNSTMEQTVRDLFDLSAQKSKLEQFYTLLFYISQHTSHPGDQIIFDVPKALNLLLSSEVFSNPEFPRQIARIHLNRKDRARPRYQVVFDRPDVRLPLNKGAGFGVFREGMCQHAKALVFYGSFSFSLTMKNHSLEVYDFDNVDLWGTFGSRGMVDVDINYVSVKSVEFLKGNALGLVKAKVSRREFEANQHSFLLELITKYVTDKSVQPIDW
jgi:hypothetical protein